MKTLDLISELRTALQIPLTSPEYVRWTGLVGKIESSLEWEARCSVTERKLMERLREGMVEVYSAYQSGMVPNFGRATAPLNALEALVRSRSG